MHVRIVETGLCSCLHGMDEFVRPRQIDRRRSSLVTIVTIDVGASGKKCETRDMSADT